MLALGSPFSTGIPVALRTSSRLVLTLILWEAPSSPVADE